jgi:DNA-binding MarR family transcriptional regulator
MKVPIRQVVQPFFKAAFLLDRVVDRMLLEERGMRIAQFRILLALKHYDGISQRRIAEYWGIAEASVSRQLKILGRKGLVQEDPNPEKRREHQLRLTAAGEKEIKEAMNAADRKLEDLFAAMDDNTRRALTENLNAMLGSMKQ